MGNDCCINKAKMKNIKNEEDVVKNIVSNNANNTSMKKDTKKLS